MTLVGTFLFVALGLWITGLFGPPPRQGGEWLGWVAVSFFGFGSVVIVGRLLDRDDQIIVDARGIYWKRWSDETIFWSEVRNITEGRVGNQRFICIELTNPERHKSKRLIGRLAVFNAVLGFHGICIDALGTDKSYQELRDAVFRSWPTNPDRHGKI